MKSFLAIMIVIAFLGAGCSTKETQPPEKRDVKVATAAVVVDEVADTVQSVGTIEAKREALLSARIMGRIKSVRAEEGDRVKKGQLLVEIDADEIRAKKSEAEQARDEGLAALREAEAALDNADVNYSRIKSLYDENAVSKKELDDMTTQRAMAESRVAQVKARIAQAGAAVKQADVMLGYSVISSPVDGVVVMKSAHAGETASPGMPLMKVMDDRVLRLVTTVKESGISGLKTGDKVAVTVDALPNEELTGAVSEIVPAADPATRSFTVKVDLPGKAGLMPGMFGRARLPVGVRGAVMLPEGCLVDREGVEGVYVVGDGGVIRFQSVRLGEELEGGREVLSGLSGGEVVAVGDLSGIREGMRAVVK